MDIKEKIEKVAKKLLSDKKLMEKFEKSPVKVIEELVGMDLPDDLVNDLIKGIKAKITVDKMGGALEGLGKFLKK